MSFEKLYKRAGALVLSDEERRKASILVIEPELTVKNTIRQMLTGLGFGTVSDATDHAQALKKFAERPFTHIIFEAKRTNMPAIDFLAKVLEVGNNTICIPSSWEPNVDDVFNLLVLGARGYLVKPFTQDSLDEALLMASKGEPISDAVLHARNRNEALASLILTAVDRLATTLRQAEQFETAQREVPRRIAGLKRAVDIGKTFADGGDLKLLDCLIGLCSERGNGPATKLGRLRRRLDERKGDPKPIRQDELVELGESSEANNEMEVPETTGMVDSV